MSGWAVLLLILVLLPVGLVSVPLTFAVKGCLRTEERRLEVGVAWGWGLLAAAIGINGRKTSFRLWFAGIALPAFRQKPGKVRAKKSREKTMREEKKHGFNLSAVQTVLNRKLLSAVLVYLRRLFRSFQLRLQVSGVYGADDPALTGLIAGLLAVLPADHFNRDLDADFSGPVLDVAGEISGRVVPIVILWFTMRLLLTEPVRKLWWTQLKINFIRRKPKEDARYV